MGCVGKRSVHFSSLTLARKPEKIPHIGVFRSESLAFPWRQMLLTDEFVKEYRNTGFSTGVHGQWILRSS